MGLLVVLRFQFTLDDLLHAWLKAGECTSQLVLQVPISQAGRISGEIGEFGDLIRSDLRCEFGVLWVAQGLVNFLPELDGLHITLSPLAFVC